MDSKKDQIIHVALKRFAHYGFNKTTMSEIALDLSITKANLYYYYADKSALIKDVLMNIYDKFSVQQDEIISKYQNDVLDILNQLLELRADFLREYYVLHINENLEWIKGHGVGTVLEKLHHNDIARVGDLFKMAVDRNEIILDDIQNNARCYVEIITGLSLIRSVADVLSGMPNSFNVEEILKSQKQATQFIFKNKLNSKN